MYPPPQKIYLISCGPLAHASDIKLIRTDTTLDLSQKAEKRCRNDAEAGEPPKATPTWAAARGPKVANKPAHRKRITTECTTRHFWSATWDFGSSSFKSTEWPVTPKPSVADPSVLHHRNPWLGPNETHASDRMVARRDFRVFGIFRKTYFCTVVLGRLPNLTQTGAERFSGV